MINVDLLGDPLPDYTPALPVKEKLRHFDDLVGHTIKAVFDPPTGKRNAELVIVTETGCWIAAAAQTDGCGEDSASVEVLCGYGGGEMLSDYCSANELMRAGVISAAEHEELRKAEEAQAAKSKEERAARLRSELAKLEGGAA